MCLRWTAQYARRRRPQLRWLPHFPYRDIYNADAERVGSLLAVLYHNIIERAICKSKSFILRFRDERHFSTIYIN